MDETVRHPITADVLARFAACDDRRLGEILCALLDHLHAFAQEVRLSDAEWRAGIAFLTAAGQACTPQRQELILLSDVLGLSALLAAGNHGSAPDSTESTVLGPFHVEDAPRVAAGADIAAGAPGRPLDVRLEVRGADGRPVREAEVDVWGADAEGLYDVQRPELGTRRRARAVMHTDAEGRLAFRTIVPTAYPVPTDGPVGRLLMATGRHPWRPAHLHFRIRASGFEPLVTHLFRAGDPYLASDVVFGVRGSLVVEMPETAPGSGRHHLAHTFVLTPAGAAP